MQQPSCLLLSALKVSPETGFAGTWHPAQTQTMRDGLAPKSMPVGKANLTLVEYLRVLLDAKEKYICLTECMLNQKLFYGSVLAKIIYCICLPDKGNTR